MRKRKGRKRAIGVRAPLLVEAKPNACWSLDLVHDQMANGQRFKILNVVDDVTYECLAAIRIPRFRATGWLGSLPPSSNGEADPA